MNTAIDLALDWDDVLDTESVDDGFQLHSISDALILSLSNLGRVDIEYITELCGEDHKTVLSALAGSIYQNPAKWNGHPYEGWETAEEYLSGNLRLKLQAAQRANKTYRNRFSSNVAALKKLLPETVEAEDIYVTLGSPWVPADVIDDFITQVLGIRVPDRARVIHDKLTGSWVVPLKRRYLYFNDVARQSVFGTVRMDALEILERTLNMKSIAVYDELSTSRNAKSKKRVLNQPETALAIEKQREMVRLFKEWVWKDTERKERLEDIFDSRYGCMRRRLFDGSFLQFHGMNESVKLYPYQKNAIARIIFSPNTLLAHDVGCGKTYVMIAAGMELRRMGLSDKNLYVVPNSIVLQWREFFRELYPAARVLCVEAKNFNPEKREATMRAIRDGDWDAVIMAHSCFDRLPLSRKRLLKDLREEMAELKEYGQESIPALRRKREEIGERIEKLIHATEKSPYSLFFDDLGITRLFVDEAHNYKNVPLETDTTRILGISANGSKKCKDMMDKVHYIQKQNDGGGVVMATGTPITNSLTDLFIMQKYLQSGELAMLEIDNFDSWIGMFAEQVTDFEIDVDTSNYRLATRFAKFHNLTELTALIASIADFHKAGKEANIPDFQGYTDTLVERSDAFRQYLEDISLRAEKVRGGHMDPRKDNMLKITTDGRKAALDLRLVDKEATFFERSKVARCVENVYRVYVEGQEARTTQLIFCDISTPKEGFNVYDDVKRLLLARGVPLSEIAFVHDAHTDAQREKLFAKVRRGEIRILLGSTFKLGTGVNVHDKLIAIHHLDVPWRPADMTQREGRILRQGNSNREVQIFRYVTEGSFDAYSWQLLETKQRFISELLAGSLSERSGSDVEDTVLNYAEVKALAVGNPMVKERVEVANELSRTLSLRHKSVENRIRLEKALLELPARIETQKKACADCLADLQWHHDHDSEQDKEQRKFFRFLLKKAIGAHVEGGCAADTLVMNYQGFDVVLPAGMRTDKPYAWLQHNGKYYVELSDSNVGALLRIDNFLEKFAEHLQKMQDGLAALRAKEKALREELERKDGYAERIEELKQKLANIDKKLGVKKHE
ncbi:MAG: hypothetical protein E7624_08580 [Ruminococcaceae bacterium]|nr:hypothetical protein [Oscillospiraceae bacterium]